MSSSSAAAASAAMRAEEIWRWKYRLYCERVVKQAVEARSEGVPRLPAEILATIVELACDRSISTNLILEALQSCSLTLFDEHTVRLDTLSLMRVSWKIHDLARPFLYEVVEISCFKGYTSFFSPDGGGKYRPRSEEWRAADYSHVRYLSLRLHDQGLKFKLPISIENPFPHIDIFQLYLYPQPHGASIATAFLKDFLQAVRHTTPVHVGCFKRLWMTDDPVMLVLDVFADSPRLVSIIDRSDSNESEADHRAAIKNKDVRSLVQFLPDYRKRPPFRLPVERPWPKRAPFGYVASTQD